MIDPAFALALFKIADRLAQLGEWLMAFGALGLFGISLLDSAFVPLPGGPDFAMIALSARTPAWMPVYAFAATAGSTVGCTFLYLAARRAGSRALNRVGPERRERIETLLGRYDMLAVAVPAILPPPFPFKALILGAGVFRLKILRFIIAIFVGRMARFLIEGWLAVRFGEDARRLIAQHGVKVLIVLVAISALGLGWRYYRLRTLRSRGLKI
ncbi:MAG TPA: VTT domain-containing protein [Blastocatellia bacterium]|nr:VTT domain-containing protein [Blastocatellia bacterium]